MQAPPLSSQSLRLPAPPAKGEVSPLGLQDGHPRNPQANWGEGTGLPRCGSLVTRLHYSGSPAGYGTPCFSSFGPAHRSELCVETPVSARQDSSAAQGAPGLRIRTPVAMVTGPRYRRGRESVGAPNPGDPGLGWRSSRSLAGDEANSTGSCRVAHAVSGRPSHQVLAPL